MRGVAAAVVGMISCTTTAWGAPDGWSLEGGRGEGVDMWRVGAQWNWGKRWFSGGNWDPGGYWDVAIGQWNSRRNAAGNRTLTEFAATPVLRLKHEGGVGLFVEGGVGAHLLSKSRISDDMNFGTTLQFGEHVGVGVVFGNRAEFEAGYRFQHLSNGGLARNNTGINFNQIRLSYYF